MTIAQQLEQKGIKKGIQIGREEGIQFGEQQEKRTLAHTMLQHGIDYDAVVKITGLSLEELIALSN